MVEPAPRPRPQLSARCQRSCVVLHSRAWRALFESADGRATHGGPLQALVPLRVECFATLAGAVWRYWLRRNAWNAQIRQSCEKFGRQTDQQAWRADRMSRNWFENCQLATWHWALSLRFGASILPKARDAAVQVAIKTQHCCV